MLVDVQAGVPDVELPHRGQVAHGLRYDAPTAQVDRLPLRVVEPAVPAGDREAGHQPLDVPLERAGQRLVEVVEAEDEPPVGRRERPEVRQVRVAAQLRRSPVRGAAARSDAIR